MRSSAVIAASAAVLLGAGSALAQLADVDVVDTEAGTAGPGRSNAIIGLGVGLAPDYEGSDRYEVGVVPFGRFSYKEYQQYLKLGPNFGSRTYQARLNVMPYEGFELGPMVTYRPGRKSVENNDVDRLPNTDNAAEGGGFTRYWLPLGPPGAQAVGLDLSGAADFERLRRLVDTTGGGLQGGLERDGGFQRARLLRLRQRPLYGRILQQEVRVKPLAPAASSDARAKSRESHPQPRSAAERHLMAALRQGA